MRCDIFTVHVSAYESNISMPVLLLAMPVFNCETMVKVFHSPL